MGPKKSKIILGLKKSTGMHCFQNQSKLHSSQSSLQMRTSPTLTNNLRVAQSKATVKTQDRSTKTKSSMGFHLKTIERTHCALISFHIENMIFKDRSRAKML